MNNRKFSPYLFLPLLVLGGYLGNYFSLPLFFGVDFIFGSIFTLLIVYYYGLSWGTIGAIIISSYTIILWKHPYAFIALVAEAVLIGWRLRKHRDNIVLLDSIYWLMIGMPFIFLTYLLGLKMTPLATELVVCKQAANGIFNALIANFIILLISSFKQKFANLAPDKLSFEQTIFNVLVAFIFFPLLFLTILQGQQAFVSMEKAVTLELDTLDNSIVKSLQTWYQSQLQGVTALAQGIEPWIPDLVQSKGTLQLPIAANQQLKSKVLIQSLMQTTQKAFPAYSNIYLADAIGNIIISMPTRNEVGKVLDKRDYQEILAQIKQSKNLQVSVSSVHRDAEEIYPHLGVTVPFIEGGRLEAIVYGSLQILQIDRFLKSNIQSDQSHLFAMFLLDDQKRLIGSSQDQLQTMVKIDLSEGGKMRRINKDVFHWLPDRPKNPMLRWRKSYYYSFVSLGKDTPWQFVIRLSAENQINDLQILSLKNLLTLLVLTGLGLVTSIFVSRRVASPLLQLAQVTTDIPKKILNQEPTPALPYSHVSEINSLSYNFGEMIQILQEQFGQILEARNTLETRVQERTGELLALNDDLAKEIMERQAIANRLQDSEERYDLAVSGTNDGIWDWNIDSDQVYYSPVWMKILGYEAKELPFTLSTWLGRIHPNELPLAQLAVQQHLEGSSEIYNFVHRMKHKDGHYLWIEAKGKCLRNEQGQAYRMVGTITDITDQKQGEEDLRLAKENAEIANRTKSEFLANMSHEIRTPMNAILGFCDLLQGITTDPRSQGYLETITSSGKALMSLINDILDLTKIEAGKLQVNYENVDIRQLINEIYQIFLEKAQQKQIELQVAIAPELPTFVRLDEVRLRQILFNVVGNAIKFTEQGAVKIEVTARDITAKTIQLIITIEDTGIGIAPEDQNRIFDVFTQSEGQSTRKYGGTGLGLTITRRLTEMLGGKITLSSSLGEGSIFTLSFPQVILIDQADLVIEPPLSDDLNQFAPATILVIDDVQSNRNLIRNYFSQTDHQILEATDGLEGIQMAKNHHPDLILMDLLMPNLDGIEATIQLRQDAITQNIPILILTAALLTDVQYQLENYCQGFLTKPLTRRHLVYHLQDLLPLRKSNSVAAFPDTDAVAIKSSLENTAIAPPDPEQLGELLAHLAEIEQNTWTTLRNTMIMRDLRQFAQQLRQWGEDYQCYQLVDYVEKLEQAIRTFDGEQLIEVMNQFPNLRSLVASTFSH